MKRQPTELEEIFANNIVGKGLTPKMCKELTQLNSKRLGESHLTHCASVVSKKQRKCSATYMHSGGATSTEELPPLLRGSLEARGILFPVSSPSRAATGGCLLWVEPFLTKLPESSQTGASRGLERTLSNPLAL